MKVVNKLNKIIKEIDGNIIGIGLKDEVFLNTIAKNDNIISCNLLESFSKESGKKLAITSVNLSKLIPCFTSLIIELPTNGFLFM